MISDVIRSEIGGRVASAFGGGCRDWPRTQLQASFKGVPFEVRDDTKTGGRRLVVHEYPSRESWDTEDLGRVTPRFRVRGFVHGDLADAQAELLFRVCTSPGPGRLILPVRPPAMARCMHVSSTFTEDAQGSIPIDMEFVLEAGEIGGVVSSVMLAGAVAGAVTTAIGAVKDVFSVRFDSVFQRFHGVFGNPWQGGATLVPGVARDAAAQTIRMGAEALNDARGRLRMKDAATASQVAFAVRHMNAQATALAFAGQNPGRVEAEVFVADDTVVTSGFAGQFATALEQLGRAAADPAELADELRSLTAFEAQVIDSPYDCQSVRAEKALTAEVAAFVRRASLLEWARAITGVRYDTREAAVSARADLAVGFAVELETVDDPLAEEALRRARDTAITYVTRTGAEMPPVIRLRFNGSSPAAVLATMIYNDATRDHELVRYNRAPHPLQMPAEINAVRPDFRATTSS
jgi:prophage DNA circulation protein